MKDEIIKMIETVNDEFTIRVLYRFIKRYLEAKNERLTNKYDN